MRVTRVAAWRPVVAAAAAADSTGFTQSFKGLLHAMHTAGLAGDLHNALDANDLSKHKGDIKRALLDLARTRPHYLSAIDASVLKALAAVPLNTDERKVRMAQQRLQASYVEGADLGAKDGGAASLQDVLRLLQCLEGTPDAQQGLSSNALARRLLQLTVGCVVHVDACRLATSPSLQALSRTAPGHPYPCPQRPT